MPKYPMYTILNHQFLEQTLKKEKFEEKLAVKQQKEISEKMSKDIDEMEKM